MVGAQVLDGANNFEETQSKFPNLRETRSKLGKLKGACQSVVGRRVLLFLGEKKTKQKKGEEELNHNIVKMI